MPCWPGLIRSKQLSMAANFVAHFFIFFFNKKKKQVSLSLTPSSSGNFVTTTYHYHHHSSTAQSLYNQRARRLLFRRENSEIEPRCQCPNPFSCVCKALQERWNAPPPPRPPPLPPPLIVLRTDCLVIYPCSWNYLKQRRVTQYTSANWQG